MTEDEGELPKKLLYLINLPSITTRFNIFKVLYGFSWTTDLNLKNVTDVTTNMVGHLSVIVLQSVKYWLLTNIWFAQYFRIIKNIT